MVNGAPVLAPPLDKLVMIIICVDAMFSSSDIQFEVR